jgi:Spy/CpxP family protein refolding chaperone
LAFGRHRFTQLYIQEKCWKRSSLISSEGQIFAHFMESTMSDEHSASRETHSDVPRRRRRGGSWLLVATIALAAGMTGAAASRAVSQHPWHGAGFFGAAFDPIRVEDRADRAVRHLAVEIDATSEQQEKLRAIVKGAVKDLLPMREKVVSARQRGWMLLTQPTLDRTAIEALRADRLALADQASKRFVQAVGDIAEMLTPEQRRKLDERVAEWREHRAFWHGWRRG